MRWKFEVFKKRKMRTKGMPFGYLEFSRAIRGKPCPHAGAPAAAASGGRPAGTGAGAGLGFGFEFGFGTRSSSI